MERSNPLFIRDWYASYYDDKGSTKEWKYGMLKLYFGKIVFREDQSRQALSRGVKANARESGANVSFEFEIPFSEIKCLNKASSSIIFPAMTISTTRNEKHWFSSFENRDETLMFIEHFFHSTLQERSIKFHQKDVIETGARSTGLGKELLRSVVDSNKTLAAAGSQLDEQGQQLRNASVKMVEMNNDLDVASRFTQGLKSWLPRWRVPKRYDYDQDNFHVLNKDDAVDIFSFSALYRDVSPKTNNGSFMQCIITVDNKGLSIMDDYQKLIQHFKWRDISRVQMVGVWELCITQYFIGKPDSKCTAVSANVRQLLKQLEKYRADKIEPISPDVTFAWSQHDMQIREQDHTLKAAPNEAWQQSSRQDDGPYQTLEMPSCREMNDLSKELTSLKSLALDVQNEQDEQLKEIDELTTAVTKGTDRLSKLDKTMNRML